MTNKSSNALAPDDKRLLIVAPSWLGDAVMATSALTLLRERLSGWRIGALVKPGIDALYAGSGFFDEVHVEARSGMMGPKRAAAKVRPRRYAAALLFTNSFSTALATRLAGIHRRIGFNRDGRGVLLTDPIAPARLADLEAFAEAIQAGIADPARFAPVPARKAYLQLARVLLAEDGAPDAPLSLGLDAAQEQETASLLTRVGIAEGDAFVAINPGANKPAKRWPAERFAVIADRIFDTYRARVCVLGGPAERALANKVVSSAHAPDGAIVALPERGLTIGSLKGALRQAALLLTNDTGPRHIAAAFNTPCVALFGPTDPRWTSIPAPKETVIVADPALPRHIIADDAPDRCAMDRIGIEHVWSAVQDAINQTTKASKQAPQPPSHHPGAA